MSDSLTDSDLEMIACLGVSIAAIIEDIENGKSALGNEFVGIDCSGDDLIINIHGVRKVVGKSYTVSALKELEKTLTLRNYESEKAKNDYKKYLNSSKKPLTSDEIGLLRDNLFVDHSVDSTRREVLANSACGLPAKNDISSSNESLPSYTGRSLELGVQINDSSLDSNQKYSVLYHPFFVFLISFAVAWLVPFGILHTVFVPIAIIQVVTISLSCYLAFRSSPTSIDIEDQMLPMFYKDRFKMAKYYVPVMLPLLSLGFSYSIMMHKTTRELQANGITTMATISKVYQQERGNGEIVHIWLDFSFQDLNGRIIEASKIFPGSNTKYLKCMNASLIKVNYSPDYPEIFEVIPPCIDGG